MRSPGISDIKKKKHWYLISVFKFYIENFIS